MKFYIKNSWDLKFFNVIFAFIMKNGGCASFRSLELSRQRWNWTSGLRLLYKLLNMLKSYYSKTQKYKHT